MSEMTNSEIKKCEHKSPTAIDSVEWCGMCGAFRKFNKYMESWSLWILPTRTPEPIDSIEKLTKLVSSIALECKKLGLTQVETSNILKHTFSTTEPTKPSYSACHENIEKLKADFDKGWKDWEKWCLFLDSRTVEPKAENGLVRLSNKNWDVICQVLRNHHEQLANGDYLKCVNAIIETLGIPSITKERLLAILPEHCGCHRDYRVCVRHEGENITIDEMKQRIEELFNEKIN